MPATAVEFNRLQIVRDEMETWKARPDIFVRNRLHVNLDPFQEDALRACGTQRAISMASCNGAGKTAVIAWRILHFMATKSHPLIIATAAKEDQLKNRLWPEIRKWLDRSKFLTSLIQWQAEKIYWRTARDTWFAIPKVARTPENMASAHADHLLYAVDEASGIDDKIFEAIDGCLTGPDPNFIMAFNPTKRAGYAYESFHKNRAQFYKIHIGFRAAEPGESTADGSYGSPERVGARYEKMIRNRWGINSNPYRVRVLGFFPNADLDALVGFEAIEKARQLGQPHAWLAEDYRGEDRPRVVLGCDPARFGDDQTAIGVAVGNVFAYAEQHPKQDTMTTAHQIRALADEWKPDLIRVDPIGIGAGVYDRLDEMLEDPDDPWDFDGDLEEFNVAESPRIEPDKYALLRDEMYFQLRDRFNAEHEEGIILGPGLDEELFIELQGQLTSIKFGYDARHQREKIESKDKMKGRGLASPDLSDLAAMIMHDDEWEPETIWV